MGPVRLSAASERLSQGQALVLVALTMTVLLLFAALAIEMGRFVSERRYLQNMVDAATLSAALEWKEARGRGESETEAEASARARALETLQSHFANDPTGTTPTPPSVPPVYQAGCTAPVCLIDGILVNPPSEPGAVRVAMRNEIAFTLGRLAGLENQFIGARAYAGLDPAAAAPLPIAVREHIDGNPGGTPVCPTYDPGPHEYYRWVFATAGTSCVDDSVGASTTDVGPQVEILAQGADANNSGAISFRGMVALDIRNFASATSRQYYNGVTAGTNPNTLKAMQFAYFCKGYPGPPFPPITSPPDPNLQVAALDGNSAGQSVAEFVKCFKEDDLVMVLVYSGEARRVPQFELRWPGGQKPDEILIPTTTGSYANNRNVRVWANQQFVGTVDVDTIWDVIDSQHPYNDGTLTSDPPLTYSPANNILPTGGNGTQVNILNVSTTDATRGIYSFIVRATANAYSNQVHYVPATLNVGNVARDFEINGPSPNGCDEAQAVGDSVTCNFSITTGGGPSHFGSGSTVTFTLERLNGDECCTVVQGFGTATVGQARSVTIPTGTLGAGIHWYVVRATGLNADGDKVTRLLPFTINVAPSPSTGNDQYVDIKGYALMRIVCNPYHPQCIGNSVWAEALTPVLSSPDDEAFDVLRQVRLLPWDYVP